MNDTAVAAAMARIIEAGQCSELQERIAAAWAAERERKNSRTNGEALNLEIELCKLLKFSTEQAKAAASSYLQRDYQQVAIETTLRFANEIASPPRRREPVSRIRPIEEDRRLWNPIDGGITEEELHPRQPANRTASPRRRNGGLVA